MLRHYDECGLFCPAKVDPNTGYRLYSAEQLPVLNRIVFLRDIGCGIAEIADAVSRWETSPIVGLLEQKHAELESDIAELRSRQRRLELAMRDAEREKIAVTCSVALKKIPSYQVVSLRKIIPDYFSESALWGELACYMRANRIKESSSELNLAIYHDLEYKDSDVDVEVCATVDKPLASGGGFVCRQTEAVSEMATTLVRGPYENISGAYLAFAEWLERNEQYEIYGTSRQICHRGPWNESNPENYLTEIQIPVKKTLDPDMV